jgi:hypothetical protein
VIYFITCPEANAVKIGVTYGVLGRAFTRLGTMQSGCPLKLELAVVIDGDSADERAFHQQFADARIHGEWFRLTDELRDFISRYDPPVKPYGTKPPRAGVLRAAIRELVP